MILNKKTAICLSICLLFFNKQSLASVRDDANSKSLASALELASVLPHQDTPKDDTPKDKKLQEEFDKLHELGTEKIDGITKLNFDF